ncbi:hypothetical protein HDU91_001525, partial [Kappamyces sp. JEL0680]
VLENPNNWMITTMALVLRSRLESTRGRTVERSCMQLQTLVDQWKNQPTDATAAQRMEYIFSLLVPSKWEMEKELGLRYMSIGVVRSALQIFERLEMWENVISYVILQQLELSPHSAKLICLLGDVRSDTSLYEKAWEVSGKRFAKAQRSLAAHYFEKKEVGVCGSCQFQKCIQAYDLALAINPLFENSWFIMGCAALQIEELDHGIRAFSRVTQIDPSLRFISKESNCTPCHAAHRSREAFNCLKEAIKVNFEASNIWENYLFVAVDLKEIGEAIRSMERIFTIRIEKTNLKNTAFDTEILELLANAIVADVPDANGQPSSIHSKRFEALLLLIATKVSSFKLFAICAGFYKASGDYRQWLEYTTKTYRSLLNNPLLGEDKRVFEDLVEAVLEVARVYVECSTLKQQPRLGDEAVVVCPDGQYQARMALKAVIGRTKVYDGTPEYLQLTDAFATLKKQ